MKLPPQQSTKGTVSLRALAGFSIGFLIPLLLFAAGPGPQWWTDRHVVSGTTLSGTADYAGVNQGQLKNIATAAFQELSANLPGGVGDMTAPSGSFSGGTGWQLTHLINSWSTIISGTLVAVTGSNTNDYGPVNIGQLKNVAKLFYNRLIEVGYTYTYPWLSSTNAPNDYAAANIGQVKNLFGFDVAYSSSGSGGIPDWWETKYFGSDTNAWMSGTAMAPSGNGLTILQAYQSGSNPIDYYNGISPALTSVSGTNQTSASGSFLSAPLVVQVASGTTPMANAPVLFVVTQGAGMLASDNSGTSPTSTSWQVLTGSDGKAQAWFRQPFDAGFTSTIAVYAEASEVDFNEITTSDTNAPAAPSDIVAIGQPDGSALVTWADNSDNETGFNVERSDDGGSTWTVVGTVDSDSTGFIDPAIGGTMSSAPIPGVTQYLAGSIDADGDPLATTSGTFVLPFLTIDYIPLEISRGYTQNVPFVTGTTITGTGGVYSGSYTTGSGTTYKDVDILSMALGDNNQASYCYVSGSFTGTNSNSGTFSGINQVTVNTWSGGTTSSGTIICDQPGQDITTFNSYSGLRDETLNSGTDLYRNATTLPTGGYNWVESPYILSNPPCPVLLTPQGNAYGTIMEVCSMPWDGGDPMDWTPIIVDNAFLWVKSTQQKQILEFSGTSFTTGTANLIVNNNEADYSLVNDTGPLGIMVLACSQVGYCGVGSFGTPNPSFSGTGAKYVKDNGNDFFTASCICLSGTTPTGTVLSGTTIFYDSAQNANSALISRLPTGVTKIATPFTPAAMNDYGMAIGGSDYWNGTSLSALSGTNAVGTALNNQNIIIGSTTTGGTATGMLWTTNSGAISGSTSIQSLVPQPYQYEVKALVPYAISNADANSMVSILCSGSAMEISGTDRRATWKPETILLQLNATTLSGTPSTQISLVKMPSSIVWQKANSNGTPNNLAVNSSGVISGIGAFITSGTNHTHEKAMALLPVRLTNIADPTVRNGANGHDWPIQFKQSKDDPGIICVAWIAGNDPAHDNAPRMPQLRAQIGGPAGLSGLTVWWKLGVVFHGQNNPSNDYKNFRDFDPSALRLLTPAQKQQLTNLNETGATGYSDDIDVPLPSQSTDSGVVDGWVPISGTVPWNIYQDSDWTAAKNRGFFGGDAKLSVKVTTNSGSETIIPEKDFYFRIAGENPTYATCEAYIQQQYNGGHPVSEPQRWTGLTFAEGRTPPNVPSYWFAYAIAKEENEDDGGTHYYNNFMKNGGKLTSKTSAWLGHEGRPDWNNDDIDGPHFGTGGYGLFQLTYESAHGGRPAEVNFIMPRDWIWNWQSNTMQFSSKIQEKLSQSQYSLDITKRKLGALFTDPSALTVTKDGVTFNFWEADVITRNNGGKGWKPKQGNTPTIWGGYVPAGNRGYLYEITHKGINNN